MRILQVLGGLNRGGAETLIMNIYRNINRTKVQFDFVIHTKERGAYYDEIIALGGKVYHCPKYNGKNHFAYVNWWKNFFKKHTEYSVVHGHVRSTAAIYLKIARRYNKFAIAHSHSTSAGQGFSGFVKKIMQFGIRFNADYFLGCSYAANKWLFGRKIADDKSRCLILRNGVDLTKFSFDEETRNKKRQELQLSEKFVVGTVGRIETPKNPLFIIAIFNEVLKNYNNSALLWVGDGSLSDKVKSYAEELHINDKIVFVGSKDNVQDYLQAMDVFLFPSLWEGLGMSLIEAQAMGLSCICSDAIPKEADVTDLIQRIDLNVSPSRWAEELLKSRNRNRISHKVEIQNSGYDIQCVVNSLEGIYNRSF